MNATVESGVPGCSHRRVEDALERSGSQRGKTPGSWRCPLKSHGRGCGDQNPSLAIDHRDGRTLVHCHAGCELEDILAEIGLKKHDLFDDHETPRAPTKTTDGPKPKRVASYEYQDDTGASIRRKVKWEPGFDGRPKSFTWEKRTERGWVKASGGEGNPQVLYRLPELRSALLAGDTIHVCAGEKDAEAVHAAGWPATTNPEGEGRNKWKSSYTEVFRDTSSEVIVLADRDNVGYQHASALLEALRSAGVTASCFEAAVGKDVSDHLSMGRGLDDLVEVDPCERAAENEESARPDHASGEVLALRERFHEKRARIDEWFDADGQPLSVPRRRFLVEDFLAERIPAFLVARGGTGKGHWEMLLATSVALGAPFAGLQVPQPRGVVFVGREDDREELQRRFVAAMRARFPDGLTSGQTERLAENLRFVDLFGVRGGRLGDDLVAETVAATKRLEQPGLVILDPLGKLLPEDAPPLNAQEGAVLVHEWIDIIVQESGCGVIAAHHVPKDIARLGTAVAGSASGSQMLEDLARCVIVLTPTQADDVCLPVSQYGYVQAEVTKQNYAPPMNEPLIFERVWGGALRPVESVIPRLELEDERVLRVLEDAGGPLHRTPWEEACVELDPSISRTKAKRARSRLVRRNLVKSFEEERKEGKRGAPRLLFELTEEAKGRERGRFDLYL